MANLADLVEEYDFLIDEAVQRVEKGGSVFFEKGSERSPWNLGDTSEAMQAAFAVLYNRVKRMSEQHGRKLAGVVEAAYCPALEDAVMVATRNPPPDETTFISELSPRYAMRSDGHHSFISIFHPLRAAIFLELLLRHPDAIPRVRASSTYFPHRLLKKEHAMSLVGLEQEIATVIPTLYSEDDVALVAEANRFLEYGYTTGITISGYFVSQGFRWREGATTADFARVFDTPRPKEAILTTLLSCLGYIKKTTIVTGKRSPKKLDHFRILEQQYAVVTHVLHGHARNQILDQVRHGATESTDTPFTRYAGIRATINGDVITLVHSHHAGGTEHLSVHAREYDTSTHLPTCVAMFAHLYNTAQRLNEMVR